MRCRGLGDVYKRQGGGGALGQVLLDAKTGDYIAQLISQTPLPAVLLPFFVATFVRLVQGSGTVAMITSASITAPIPVSYTHLTLPTSDLV